MSQTDPGRDASWYIKLKELLYARWGVQFFRNGGPHGLDLKIDLQRLGQDTPRRIFDVGANVGQTADRFARLFPTAKIDSFEPVRKTFNVLQKRMAAYPNVAVHNVAFSDSCGRAEINLTHDSVCASFEDNIEERGGRLTGDREEVDLQTLSKWCAERSISHVDLLKIDTEGHELRVLGGGEDMLKHGAITAILLEVHFLINGFADLSNTQLFLRQFGYSLAGIYEQAAVLSKRPVFYANCLFVRQHRS